MEIGWPARLIPFSASYAVLAGTMRAFFVSVFAATRLACEMPRRGRAKSHGRIGLLRTQALSTPEYAGKLCLSLANAAKK